MRAVLFGSLQALPAPSRNEKETPMRFLLLLFLLSEVSSEPPWSELTISIERASGYSSDQVTVCLVRVVNNGPRTWPGRTLHFEARAIDGGLVVERARGKFGLSLPPHGTLETLISFSGLYSRFEVGPAATSPDGGSGKKRSSGRRPKRPRKP
jgi:hypothetical protein